MNLAFKEIRRESKTGGRLLDELHLHISASSTWLQIFRFSIGFDEITSLSCFATLLPIALADFDEVVLGKDLGKVLSWAKIWAKF